MRLVVTGGRNFTSYHKVEKALNQLPFTPTVLIQGGARGADSIAKQWAESKGIHVVTIDALWDYHGKSAGDKRNQAMIDIMRPDYCVAFPGGYGTADMVRRCKANHITVWSPYCIDTFAN